MVQVTIFGEKIIVFKNNQLHVDNFKSMLLVPISESGWKNNFTKILDFDDIAVEMVLNKIVTLGVSHKNICRKFPEFCVLIHAIIRLNGFEFRYSNPVSPMITSVRLAVRIQFSAMFICTYAVTPRAGISHVTKKLQLFKDPALRSICGIFTCKANRT